MRILLTGANGYIGKRLLPALLEAGHSVVCLVRDRNRFAADEWLPPGSAEESRLEIWEGDLLEPDSLAEGPSAIDAAFYLVHSMGSGRSDFPSLEERSARNFGEAIRRAGVRQVVYLSGIVNEAADDLSPHLASRLNVERILRDSGIPVTVLRAAIIVGSGSASFEIMRDLVEKLPLMVAPKWLRTRCQPIAIRNVIETLMGVLGNPESFDQTYDIGGPEVFTYQELLLAYAEVRGLRRRMFPVPLLTPRLSGYWLYFVTNTSYPLARSLVDSLTHDMTCSETRIRDLVPLDLLTFREAVARALDVLERNEIPSAWFDSVSSGKFDGRKLRSLRVPRHGVFTDRREVPLQRDPETVRRNIWRIGGEQGWYSVDWAWQLRGWIDRVCGGIGLRRGRRDPENLRPGDALDFWRVLVADRETPRLVLVAEMKLPGEAWLEFQIEPSGDSSDGGTLVQTATFRPRGLTGRLYWLAVLPFHHVIFASMAREIATREPPRIGTSPGEDKSHV